MSATEMNKPPPIVVAPAGIDALRTEKDQPVDFDWLCRYPPYQMYVEEREPNLIGAPADVYAQQRTQQAAQRGELPQWLEQYVAWFEGKGYWKGENPLGRV